MEQRQNIIHEKISGALFFIFIFVVFGCILGPSAYQTFIVGSVTFVSADTFGYGGGGGGTTTDSTAFAHGHFLADPPYILTRYLGAGDEGLDVFSIQIILTRLHFFDPSVTPTGFYGPATVAAVKLFQAEHNIMTTGNIGPLTRHQFDITNSGQIWVDEAPVNSSVLRIAITDLLRNVAQTLKVPLHPFGN